MAELDQAERELSRSLSLASSGAIAAQALERTQTSYRVRSAAAEAARQSLALADAGPAAEEIWAAEATLAAARAKWTRATLRLSDAQVTAPISGRVVRKLREEGDFVSAEAPFIEGADTLAIGSPLVTLADSGPQEVTVDINETDIARVSLGQRVQVVPTAFPSVTLAGAVSSLAVRADRNKGTLQVRVTLEKSEALLPEDLSVRLSFLATTTELGGLPASVVIPARALLEKDGRQFVYVPAGGRAQRRDVAVGARSEEGILVTRGLSAGERVIVSNLDRLEDGKRIEPQ
jgi:RND family efflux transporter MFP subunit